MSGTEKIGQTQFCANNDEHIHKNGMNVKLWIWKKRWCEGACMRNSIVMIST